MTETGTGMSPLWGWGSFIPWGVPIWGPYGTGGCLFLGGYRCGVPMGLGVVYSMVVTDVGSLWDGGCLFLGGYRCGVPMGWGICEGGLEDEFLF